ncbi:hypothetical protein FA95DRAFT_851633 [Auriscalpium vulgare]|uniref:Uncharacterized protein n=1 Tax=Auriscalpium vulgare TaxID=40419 RepID=A0ACB8RAJ4_9AGAM|nr:hypothetical protein FA95DRAFT_851633 [Auriscalpium vulgare]
MRARAKIKRVRVTSAGSAGSAGPRPAGLALAARASKCFSDRGALPSHLLVPLDPTLSLGTSGPRFLLMCRPGSPSTRHVLPLVDSEVQHGRERATRRSALAAHEVDDERDELQLAAQRRQHGEGDMLKGAPAKSAYKAVLDASTSCFPWFYSTPTQLPTRFSHSTYRPPVDARCLDWYGRGWLRVMQ